MEKQKTGSKTRCEKIMNTCPLYRT